MAGYQGVRTGASQQAGEVVGRGGHYADKNVREGVINELVKRADTPEKLEALMKDLFELGLIETVPENGRDWKQVVSGADKFAAGIGKAQGRKMTSGVNAAMIAGIANTIADANNMSSKVDNSQAFNSGITTTVGTQTNILHNDALTQFAMEKFGGDRSEERRVGKEC